ncbi:cyclase family protein [Clostridium beijerinckii]|uniref:Kynurenine formamidase n=1 Tax=Clostridium beijerinckii TaxID=1520 RepID=A0A1S8SKC2_CLOBE|nr:cyclase family protein [Clostridium beijerinckii]NRY61546.1 kynurenine formamidase [Clostridium beijerinckii]OOM65859.1 kynurenine formamidase [Clostridium beijerinckii]
MKHQIIDLSMSITDTKNEPQKVTIKRIDHKTGTNILVKELTDLGFFNDTIKFETKDIPDGEFLANEIVEFSTHCGTHIDAPYHFGSTSEGKVSKKIEDIPLEWCYSDGVVLDLTYKGECELITRSDIEKCLNDIGYKLKEYDIVLIKTGYDKYFGMPKYLSSHPGMSEEATEYICSHGVKIIGIDTAGFDLPFKKMVDNFAPAKKKEYFWPSHLFGRKKEYLHMERLANLTNIPCSFGFKVMCFPIKIANVGASWSRVVAIV